MPLLPRENAEDEQVTDEEKGELRRARNLKVAADVEHRYQRIREAIKVRIYCAHPTCQRNAKADISDWPVLEGLLRRELGRGALELELRAERLQRIAAGRAQSPGENETTPMAMKLKNANKVRPPEPPTPPPPPPPPVSTEPPTIAEVLQDIRLELGELRDHTGNQHTERLVEIVDRLAEVVQEATKPE